MSDGDDVNGGKGFGGWAKDRPFIKVAVAYITLVAFGMGAISYGDGNDWGTVLYMGMAAFVGGLLLFAAAVLGFSTLIWLFQHHWVQIVIRPLMRYVLSPIGRVVSGICAAYVWLIERLFKIIGILLALAVALAVIGGIVGLLLFGLRQLF